ncbi:uncharacterized protein FTJAE_7229 [Fusarium tjaetaba]|uniref:Uncharacterized protein n=1 Tax=Fusarium tjaetaba TaxID=1567544 RepID=A0A8H5RCG1_9HYPO|nr:uncharacterized protein FTJAE_7229 [Fusarium tjaetaba]KAF5633265.1 hypothetical protein FTJAE_7229 [Fusarium tjaetaba]
MSAPFTLVRGSTRPAWPHLFTPTGTNENASGTITAFQAAQNSSPVQVPVPRHGVRAANGQTARSSMLPQGTRSNNHGMTRKDGSLQRLVVGVLTRTSIDWTAIDILRVGYVSFGDDYRRIPERPVTMLISVSTDSTTFQQAEAAIIACKEILARFNLEDIEVEIKESIITTASSSPSSAQSDPTTSLGKEAPRLHPGPFDNDILDKKYDALRDISDDGKAYVLTCRKVLFAAEDIEEYRHQYANNTRDVLQPGGETLNKLTAHFDRDKATNDECIQIFSEPLHNTPENQPQIKWHLQ